MRVPFYLSPLPDKAVIDRWYSLSPIRHCCGVSEKEQNEAPRTGENQRLLLPDRGKTKLWLFPFSFSAFPDTARIKTRLVCKPPPTVNECPVDRDPNHQTPQRWRSNTPVNRWEPCQGQTLSTLRDNLRQYCPLANSSPTTGYTYFRICSAEVATADNSV